MSRTPTGSCADFTARAAKPEETSSTEKAARIIVVISLKGG
jgi:hypothetical protein